MEAMSSSGTDATPSGTDAFRSARDQLLRLREQRDQAASEFRWPDVGPAFNWARDWFDVIAAGNEQDALRIMDEEGTEERFSFDALRRESNRLARGLIAKGLRRGDVVMIMLPNQAELWIVMLAVLKAGGVVLPTSIVLGPHELQDRIDRADVRLVVATPGDARKFGELEGDFQGLLIGSDPEFPPAGRWMDYQQAFGSDDEPVHVETKTDDPALVYFTSGTTSLPKIVRHSHASYPVGHLTTMYWLGVRPGDTHMVISSPGWGKHAWSAFFAPWTVGATVFVLDYARFDAERLVAELERAQVTTFCAPPTVWRMLIQHDLRERPSALRELLSAGEPLNPEVIARFREWWGLTIRDGYGQTETTALIANTPGEEIVPGAMGKPLPGTRIDLIDPVTGKPADEGEICIDLRDEPAVNLMSGYLDDPDATARAIRDGYFHTGDVASRDADGHFTFIGRTDDIFKSSDYKVSPFEVESALIEHEAIAEAAVVGAPDETRLNITKAYVSLAAGTQADESTARAILAHARAALPPYLRVRRVEFAELPKTSSGKIRRVELRQREIDAAGQGERLPGEWREEDFPDLKH